MNPNRRSAAVTWGGHDRQEWPIGPILTAPADAVSELTASQPRSFDRKIIPDMGLLVHHVIYPQLDMVFSMKNMNISHIHRQF
jgi:hypothetical protein